MRTKDIATLAVLPACLVGWLLWRVPTATHVPTGGSEPVLAPADSSVSASNPSVPDDGHDDDRSYVFRIPSGEPTALSCDEARTIIDQVRSGLAYVPEAVSASSLATSTADWLDPHGLFSVAKDAPSVDAIRKAAPDLLADLEGKRQRSCAAATAPGAVLDKWVSELRDAFDKGRRAPGSVGASAAAKDPLPPDGSARNIAEELGRRAGAFEAAHGAEGTFFADEARRRFFPSLDAGGWSRVILASAVRAYVPLIDPHGEWAPFDEESRIYEIDLAPRPPSRLWGRVALTAVGVRITEAAAPPFANDDIVLSVANVATAGLPLEQIDQLAYATTSDLKTPLNAVVFRGDRIVKLDLAHEEDAGASPRADDALPFERVAFGDGDALIVPIRDVRDDLGEELAALLSEQREVGPRKLAGLVLDLRGNGGGSTDGALGALSLFLPGAPLFAMRRRDGTVERDRAPIPRDRDRWSLPVATFVDGTTASAAEMIAGALAAYKRGPTVGTTTFGKGCAQEYVDDDAHAGVLRLTTLVYALPDGSPVQRVGLVPQIRFPFVPDGDPVNTQEREAKVLHTAPPWRGPDIREASIEGASRGDDGSWPAHGGNVGPCREADVCKALRLLGSPKRVASAKH